MSDFSTRALEMFYKLCEIPHCSYHTQDMHAFLCSSLESQGYTLAVDSAFNIYAKKGKPRICLQGHYDMVCVGDSTKHKGVTPIKKDGFLYAKDSSLGADNGIALACMLALKESHIELLFTNDEEVGMIGANNLSLKIESPLLLNLDSEDIHEIVLGCAGGVDIECNIDLKSDLKPLDSILPSYPYMYKITSSGFLGGHSGIEIHKNKENALSEFGFFLSTIEAYIITLNGGEKRNSIPVGLEAIIICDKRLDSIFYTPNGASFDITPLESLESSDYAKAYHKNAIAPLLCGIHSGVYAGDKQGVLSSLNLSLITQKQESLELILMARANTQDLLKRTCERLEIMLPYLNPHCSMKTSGYYAPWERSIEPTHKALTLLSSLYAKHNITPHLTQIHAGLECGILKKQILAHSHIKNFEILSIGPTIHAPHSCNERLDLKDFEIFCDILQDFVTLYKE